jgi:hypothetical protein
MNYAGTLLPEFDQEMANTRKVLERIPDDRLEWQAHPRSHTIGWNANHVADLVNWLVEALTKPSLDVAPVGGEPYKFPRLTSRQEILDLFDRNVAAARRAITEVKDEEMGRLWTLSQGGKPFFTMPRSAVARGVVNHLIHHRAHLCTTNIGNLVRRARFHNSWKSKRLHRRNLSNDSSLWSLCLCTTNIGNLVRRARFHNSWKSKRLHRRNLSNHPSLYY